MQNLQSKRFNMRVLYSLESRWLTNQAFLVLTIFLFLQNLRNYKTFTIKQPSQFLKCCRKNFKFYCRFATALTTRSYISYDFYDQFRRIQYVSLPRRQCCCRSVMQGPSPLKWQFTCNVVRACAQYTCQSTLYRVHLG